MNGTHIIWIRVARDVTNNVVKQLVVKVIAPKAA